MKIINYISIAIIAIMVTSCGEKSNTKENNKVITTISNGISTSTFKVWGNCDMCKETIEGSLKVDGITKAEWNTESKMIVVNYDSTKISLNQIQENIANAGYDNVKFSGLNEAYKNLPECCQYERKK